ncbi:CDP-diacylglycerol--serine O-phosphatidyltransferase [Anaplasma phagocytophilum]|uniref:CDP-diacylglycerol--serine O-phosphatidyltransferase n=4 Tax=Anaplasma phagocytophilum TaxID=948 RepID=A0A0F3PYQ3_ANAPH|nr:CDP-diacylglycerol--serine O-phosphatidyltransferase [Anaplasma phagocytophilum]KJZ99538.1 CDP-diacylglycerol-serine O-phosphatidyltransferase [Anaplasma phagocytophilum str. CR1007]AGR78836.1 CDP-diacylglycerol--serine O-phosphatidyltransferase [Anaplasma phagocytophilum str. HZ2]AGR80083.1 CDP-diacylglycerol--serine O-phosphatidyltransferase [Anaplasma phagocytophilum str. JM]AGR81338.1 CDP-diacylglycerol--serine O-phosphatidyltransferase [Anaplasma phagocytophilum str. Dog2]EOA60888.1 CD
MGESDIKERSGDGYLPIVKLFPSVVTMLGLCAGLTSIKYTFAGNWELAAILIIVAAFMDGIDGRIARLLNSATGFGAQLDSLADFLNFGVAPAFLLYFWLLRDMKVIGWMLVMIFVVCMSIRLARFNVSLNKDKEKDDWRKYFFVGVPAPIGAGLSLVPVMLTFSDINIAVLDDALQNKNIIAIYFVFVAFLSVSNIPTASAKYHSIPKRLSYLFITLLAVLMVLAITNPWITFPIMGFTYLMSIPIFGVYYMYVDSKRSNMEEEDAEALLFENDEDDDNV